jgi:hypothetical protein
MSKDYYNKITLRRKPKSTKDEHVRKVFMQLAVDSGRNKIKMLLEG